MRKWRELFAINQTRLASTLNVSSSVISDYEGGRRSSPGVNFLSKYIHALLKVDDEAGSPFLKSFQKTVDLPLQAVLALKEFSIPVTVDELRKTIQGEIIACKQLADNEVYGYTVVDSIRAIEMLSGADLTQLMGRTTKRALIFTNASTGRATMVAVRVATLKPGAVVLHGPDQIDPLAIRLAERESIPLLVSRLKTVRELVDALRKIPA
jgi:putative transcriptional regulator